MSIRAEFTKDVVVSDGVYVDARAYGSSLNKTTIDAAVTAIGSGTKALLLTNGSWTIDDDLDLSGIRTKFEQGAILSVASGKTLTMGVFEAPVSQIFSGSGTIALDDATATVYPEWWGTGNDTLYEACSSSGEWALISLGVATYTITKPVTLGTRSLIGRAPWQTKILADSSFTGEYMIEVNSYSRCSNFFLDGALKAVRLLYLHNIINLTYFDHIYLRNTSKAAVYVYRDGGAKSEDIHMSQVHMQAMTTLTEPLVYINNTNESQFIGCKFWGNNAAYSNQTDQSIVELDGGSSGNLFLNCSFTYAATDKYGLEITGNAGPGHNNIIGCTFERNARGIGIGTESTAYRTHVYGNRIFYTGDGVSVPGIAINILDSYEGYIHHIGGYSLGGSVVLGSDSELNTVQVFDNITVTDAGTNNNLTTYNATNEVTSNKKITFEDDVIIQGDATIYGALSLLAHATFTDGDATPSVLDGNFFRTGNTGATTITDLDDGVSGQIVIIAVRDNNTTFEHTDADNLVLVGGVDWSPVAYDTIVFINSSDIWYEIARSSSVIPGDLTVSGTLDVAQLNYSRSTLAVNDTTPSVDGGNFFVTANTGATSITDFDDGTDGQIITILIKDANTTLVYGAGTLVLSGGVDWTPASGDTITMVSNQSTWYEISRSDNT